MVTGSGRTTSPAIFVNVAPSRSITTTVPSSSGTTLVVRPSTAGMSDARIVSPDPIPRRAATRRAPRRAGRARPRASRRARTPRPAPGPSHGRHRPDLPRTAPRSGARRPPVSVSEARRWPSFSRRARRTWKFSTIPLWMTAMRPVQSTWGWALASVGAPWVAHLVCPMATVPVSGGCESSSCSSRSSRPARRRTESPPSATATPAESYPRYSKRRNPSKTMGRAGSEPT